MQLLEQHFDAAFAAPDGIKKLRELILTLAMQGKLVEQDPSDQPASELLMEIEQEKRRLVAAGKIKAQKPLSPIEADEVPYEVPTGWEWVRLGELEPQFQNGISKRNGKSGVPVTVLRLADIRENQICSVNTRKILLSNSELVQYKLESGDILITRVNGSTDLVGSFIINNDSSSQFAYCDHFIRMRFPYSGYNPQFLNLLSKSRLVREQIESKFVTTAGQKTVNQTHISTLLVALPPLPEQHRIVARIDELMARCDELEALRVEREQKRLDAHAAALNALLGAQEPAAFAEAWQFMTQHFSDLHSVPKNVTELRKAVLQLAVMGKLVEQDPSDPPASELLLEIEQRRNYLIEHESLRTKAETSVSKDEQVFGCPPGWSYEKLGNLAKFIDYRGRTPDKTSSGIPLITAKNVRLGYINRDPYEYLSEDEYCTWMTRGFPRLGDLLITTEAPLGNVAIIDISDKFALAQRVICLQLHRQEFNEYLRYLFMSPKMQEILLSLASGMTATGIKASKLKELSIPTPPLSEQRRIVDKIDQLMTLCDQLDAKIAGQTSMQSALLASVMAAATPASAAPTHRPAPARAPAGEPVRRGPNRPRKEVTEASSEDEEVPVVRRKPGRPRKEPTEAVSAEATPVTERRGPGRPRKNPAEPTRSIPEATSTTDAIRRLEALKIERATGTRQVGLFESEAEGS
ncbi:restriction endonuclease subunit S [Deinococcus aquaticus]|uniref:restriction endonuclease subunit S n=1 Tax=Deinococcus aquaticus TaxID=328692 RepID=UPI003F472A7B